MKRVFTAIAGVVLVLIAADCAGRTGLGNGDLKERNAPHSVMAAEQLRRMESATGFDALKTMSGYFSHVNQTPAPQFVLILDGAHLPDLELLKSIEAKDLFEIRIVGASQSMSLGKVEVVVTTLTGRRKTN